MNPERLKDIGLGIAFLLIQIVLFRHLKILQMQPDLVLIFLVWYTARRGRTSSIVMAAGLGFLQDGILDFWGLNMFSKTLLVFISYNFIPRIEKKSLLIGQVFLTTLVAAFVHNLIFLAINSVIEAYSAEIFLWQNLIGNSLYTAMVAGFIYLFTSN